MLGTRVICVILACVVTAGYCQVVTFSDAIFVQPDPSYAVLLIVTYSYVPIHVDLGPAPLISSVVIHSTFGLTTSTVLFGIVSTPTQLLLCYPDPDEADATVLYINGAPEMRLTTIGASVYLRFAGYDDITSDIEPALYECATIPAVVVFFINIVNAVASSIVTVIFVPPTTSVILSTQNGGTASSPTITGTVSRIGSNTLGAGFSSYVMPPQLSNAVSDEVRISKRGDVMFVSSRDHCGLLPLIPTNPGATDTGDIAYAYRLTSNTGSKSLLVELTGFGSYDECMAHATQTIVDEDERDVRLVVTRNRDVVHDVEMILISQ